MEKYINGGIIKSFTVFYNSEEKLIDVMEELQDKVDLTIFEAYDNESGLEGEVRISPNEIDTSSEGHKIVTYTAIDKVGNVKELVYSINVVK